MKISCHGAHLSLMDMCLAVIMSHSSSPCSGRTESWCVSAAGGRHTLRGKAAAVLDVTAVASVSSESTKHRGAKSITAEPTHRC